MSQVHSAALDAELGEDEVVASASSVAAKTVRLSIHDDIAAVEGDWRAFQVVADATVFQSYEWLSAWQRHVGARMGVRPAIVVGRDAGGGMLFLLPLMVERSAGFRRLTWLGSDLCDYNAPLLAPGFAGAAGVAPFAALWHEIGTKLRAHPALGFDIAVLPKMPAEVGSQANPFMQLATTKNPSGAYLAHFGGDWETFYAARRSVSTQRRDRTRRKKLSELGEVRLVTPERIDEIERTLGLLMAQKGQAFARMGVPNIFERPGWTEFFHALTTDPASRDIAHLSRLDVGPTAVAVTLGLHRNGHYYYVVTGYEASGEAAKYSPGAVHLQDLMRHAAGSGCAVFDFTIGDEPYKREWSDTDLTLYDHISAATWRGWAVMAPMLAARRAKRWIKQTPAVWNAVRRVRALTGSLRGR